MENNHKIIIAVLIGVIIILGGVIMGTLLKEPTKTVELFENGTTIQVSADTELKSHDEFSTTFVTGKNTTIIGVDNNNLVGALASKMLSTLIVEKGEKQDNGLYLLDKSTVMEIGDQLGLGYDENNIRDVYVGIRHNNTVNQSIFVIGIDQNEMINILNSVNWKLGIPSNTTDINADSSLFNGSALNNTSDNILDNTGGNDNDYYQSSSDELDDDYYDYDYDDSYSVSSDSGSSSSDSESSSSSDSGSSDGGSSSSIETTVP